MGKCGGMSGVRVADSEAQAVADSVRSEVEAAIGKVDKFVAASYATQVVAGTNYFIKVQTGDDKYVHIRVFKNLQGGQQLSAHRAGKTADDELEYFDASQ